MPNYYQVTDGEWILPTMNKHKQACCDCGLVHLVDFRLVKKHKGKLKVVSAKSLGLMIAKRAVRDDKLTKGRRKQVSRSKG